MLFWLKAVTSRSQRVTWWDVAPLLTEPDTAGKGDSKQQAPTHFTRDPLLGACKHRLDKKVRDAPIIKSATSWLREINAVLGEKNAIQRSEQEER